MKILTTLPADWASQFLPPISKGNKLIFPHRLTQCLEIQAPKQWGTEISPFGLRCKVMISAELAENAAGKRYESRAKLILLPIDSETPNACLDLETRKGKFFHCDRPQKPLLVIPYESHEKTFDFLILWVSLEQK